MKHQNKKIIEKIIDLEMHANGFYHLSGASVSVKNIQHKKNGVWADVTLCSGEGEPKETFEGAFYPYGILGVTV